MCSKKTICFYSILLLNFLFFIPVAFSQNETIDSLKYQLKIHPKNDTTRVNILNDLAFSYYREDPAKTLQYIEESMKLADAVDFKKGKARAIYVKGIAKMSLSIYNEAIQYFEKSAQLYTALDFKRGISNCYNGIGIVYSNQGNYEKSTLYYEKSVKIDEEIGLEENIPHQVYNIGINYFKTDNYPRALLNFKKALRMYKKSDNKLGMANCLNTIAILYQNQGNYPLSLEFHSKSLSLAEKTNDSLGIAKSLNNIGLIYKHQEQFDRALAFYERSYKIYEHKKNKAEIAVAKNNIASVYIHKREYQKAIPYLNDALKISTEINHQDLATQCLNNLGDVYFSLKKYSEAYNYFDRARNINLDINNQFDLCISYVGITKVYTQQKKYPEALNTALKAHGISKKLNLLEQQKDVNELLSEIYESTGDYKNALLSYEQFKLFNDSLFNKENIEKITQLEYEYKYQNELASANYRELKLTKKVKTTNKDLEKSKQNYLWTIIISLLVTMLLGGIIFYLRFRNIKSKNQNIIIEQRLLRSQMTPHFIFNSLSVLQGMILNKEEKKSVNYLSKFSRLLRIILENSRDKTVSLEHELAAVENYLALQNLENESYRYSVSVDETVDVTQFIIPPMLIQPFVENAIEHAFVNVTDTKKINVHITYMKNNLICTITDNGIGIDSSVKKREQQKTSLSTAITNERLKILSKDLKVTGTVTIEDRKKFKENGTIVTIVIPYKIRS